MKPKKAILWDNDGVLVDTEKLFFKATQEILAQQGVELTRDMFIRFTLVEGIGPWQHLRERGLGESEIARLKQERNVLYSDYLRCGDLLIKGVKETVARLSERYAMCIVTSSRRDHFELIHTRTGLLPFFRFALTREDYRHAKPDPEPYLTAVRRIGYPPEKCVTVEDSRRGLLASVGAEIDCIVVPQPFTLDSDFREAARVLAHVGEIEAVLG